MGKKNNNKSNHKVKYCDSQMFKKYLAIVFGIFLSDKNCKIIFTIKMFF